MHVAALNRAESEDLNVKQLSCLKKAAEALSVTKVEQFIFRSLSLPAPGI